MAERDTAESINAGDQLNSGYFNSLLNYGYLGEVRMFALSETGAITKAALQSGGWAICDGTMPAAQGISSANITTATPNLENKFLRGSDDEASGATGGEDTHVLTIAELAAHTHTIYAGTGGGSASPTFGGNTTPGTTLASSSAGSGTAHENRPAFYELVFFMKVKVTIA